MSHCPFVKSSYTLSTCFELGPFPWKQLCIIFHVKSMRKGRAPGLKPRFQKSFPEERKQMLHMQKYSWSELVIYCCSIWIIFFMLFVDFPFLTLWQTMTK